MTPYRATGWVPFTGPANGPAPGWPNNNQYGNQPAYQPSPADQHYGANSGYYGGQQNGVELQQPPNAYKPPEYGPAHGKEGIIR